MSTLNLVTVTRKVFTVGNAAVIVFGQGIARVARAEISTPVVDEVALVFTATVVEVAVVQS